MPRALHRQPSRATLRKSRTWHSLMRSIPEARRSQREATSAGERWLPSVAIDTAGTGIELTPLPRSRVASPTGTLGKKGRGASLWPLPEWLQPPGVTIPAMQRKSRQRQAVRPSAPAATTTPRLQAVHWQANRESQSDKSGTPRRTQPH